MALPDYADWLTPERLTREEEQWGRDRVYERYAHAIDRLVRESQREIEKVVELGCGTGWVPTAIKSEVQQYICIDRNPGCLELARRKNASRTWVQVQELEIRACIPSADLVCSFAVLKHFRLSEWKALFAQLFALSSYGLFTIPIAPESKDDGTEFTHTWLSEEAVAAAIKYAGHKELWRDNTDPLEPIIAMRKWDL